MYMKIAFFLLLALTATLTSKGQTTYQIDSLCLKMCETLESNREKVDSVRQKEAYEKHLYSFLAKVEREQINSVFKNIFFRLQKLCADFGNILDRANPTKGDWKIVQERPKIQLTRKDCDEFLGKSKYKYLEYDGDTVNLVINKSHWIDHFKDGTHSKLTLSRISDCQFEIEFVESDNELRRNFSKPGDKYKYHILDKIDNYYLLSVETDGNDRIAIFKMYE